MALIGEDPRQRAAQCPLGELLDAGPPAISQRLVMTLSAGNGIGDFFLDEFPFDPTQHQDLIHAPQELLALLVIAISQHDRQGKSDFGLGGTVARVKNQGREVGGGGGGHGRVLIVSYYMQ